MPQPAPERRHVFISYTRVDRPWVDRLQQMMQPLLRAGGQQIALWDDSQIKPGAKWRVAINTALAEAKVALLLVSDAFLASEFVMNEEVPKLLAAAEAEGLRVLWVSLSPCLVKHTAIGEYQAVLPPDHYLNALPKPKQQLALKRIAEYIFEAIIAAAPVVVGQAIDVAETLQASTAKPIGRAVPGSIADDRSASVGTTDAGLSYPQPQQPGPFKPKSYTDTFIAGDQDVSLDDILATLDIDREAYAGRYSSYAGTKEAVTRWYNMEQRVYTILKHNESQRVIGYVNAIPVSDEAFAKISSGVFSEQALDNDDIRPYSLPGCYKLYLASIALAEEHRSFGNLKSLIDGFLGKLLDLSNDHIYVQEVIADAITDAGMRMCEQFGFQRVISTPRKSLIWKVKILPPEFRVVTDAGSLLREQCLSNFVRLNGMV